jgi:RNA polymerase subunit RPABC4/transcription elongation factor Spt4
MVILCSHCKYVWISEEITRCPNCNSANVGPHPRHYTITKLKKK